MRPVSSATGMKSAGGSGGSDGNATTLGVFEARDVAAVGLSAYAVEQLGDIVTVTLPAIAPRFRAICP